MMVGSYLDKKQLKEVINVTFLLYDYLSRFHLFNIISSISQYHVL